MSTTSRPLPPPGTYPLKLASGLFDDEHTRKESDELLALKYAFKPGSISHETPGYLSNPTSGDKKVIYETSNGARQVFDVREESSKARECVIIFDEGKQRFTLNSLPTTLNLTLNRSLSNASRPTTGNSTASTSSSASIPLAAQKRPLPETAEEETIHPNKTKKPRASEPAARRSAPANDAKPSKQTNSKPKPKAGAKTTKNSKAKAPVIPEGKIKSAEFIEDSDEEYDLDNDEGEDDEGIEDADDGIRTENGDNLNQEYDNEFARMMAETLAEPEAPPNYQEPHYNQNTNTAAQYGQYDSDSTSDSDDSDDEDELGGATYVGQAPRGRSSGAQMSFNGETEWL